MAVCQNNIELVKLLVQGGADMDAPDPEHRRTPLLVAALLDYGELVDLLLTAGADAEIRCGRGETPFTIVVQKGCSHALKSLLRHDRTSRRSPRFLDAWNDARRLGHNNVVLVLEEHIMAEGG
ncbi:hypothetical protein BD289DRAFT_421498 [Coniella lustricola]|uniref:Uncharacterized protein n=1 Tax=Coniella lustricola TaxID=2025994 RepID=A0A2T3ALK0_9PEZI|nr:hypothetical protein BD289DRAFT_421498 [Coniella lustricola]